MERLMKLSKIISKLESRFPLKLQEDWDNSGLLVGDLNSEINRIQISLDVTDEVIENAIKIGANLIITHHPLIFKPIKRVTSGDNIGKKILKLIKNGISLYSMHTNLDSAKMGLNEYIMNLLGVENGEVLDKNYKNIYRIGIYIPEDKFIEFRKKIISFDKIYKDERYEKVSYSTEVEETFFAKEKANPAIGEKGKLSIVENKKLDIIIEKKYINNFLNYVSKNHPYEDFSYELIKLENKIENGGIGRIYKLDEKIKISEYIKIVKEKLNINNIRAVYDEDKEIKKIGLVNGSGASYISRMKNRGVELFITSDIKYHEAFDARELGMALLDIGHYETEIWFSDIIKKELLEIVEVDVFNSEKVFKYF
ncbi:Nif3-like dinuclear metal center hexameric protein [Haliovirga abyssi]|uniref:GTP cyclohydrolase 1 type 2 homolog n=1 Tax=Haliovirga abyssi TaxID=2996794 RepID=A0AAU9DN37_9FUSO|nr:Nif3-like dinuclear metal center hexameric protein [Haliovirga abyssi]BDU49738.1 GTP cyclohydrolase 1 type 2 [Haliovirga abyssi]